MTPLKKSPAKSSAVVGDVRSRRTCKRTSFPSTICLSRSAVVFSPMLGGPLRDGSGRPDQQLSARLKCAEMDKNLPLYDVKTFDDVFSKSAAQPRFQALLLTCFAAISIVALGAWIVWTAVIPRGAANAGNRITHRFRCPACQRARHDSAARD